MGLKHTDSQIDLIDAKPCGHAFTDYNSHRANRNLHNVIKEEHEYACSEKKAFTTFLASQLPYGTLASSRTPL
jgi:hypothetical protein